MDYGLDAWSLRNAEASVLARIVPIQWPARALPTAVRTVEGEEVVVLHPLSSVIARPARCHSAGDEAAREGAGRRAHQQRGGRP
jgi:hypothetical protein